MKVQIWGAAQTVTGSMHLIHHAGRQILLDCGLYQGRRKIAFEKNRELPFDGEKIDAGRVIRRRALDSTLSICQSATRQAPKKLSDPNSKRPSAAYHPSKHTPTSYHLNLCQAIGLQWADPFTLGHLLDFA